MTITSIPAARLIMNSSDALNTSQCETCRSPVELTASVLLKGSRIVGCPSCDWGAVRARAARAARALPVASPLHAVG